MIGRIRGEVIDHDLQQVLIDVGGVAYEVEVPLTTAYELSQAQGPVSVFTHLVVRDDAHLLFGFATKEDRTLFRTLIKVNGVGPKMGLAILSGLDSNTFAQTVRAGDVKALTGVPGVGKKTAERIILDMKDRLPELPAGETLPAAKTVNDASADAESALISLGYKPQEAARAIAQVEDGAEDVETIIKLALKQLMQSLP